MTFAPLAELTAQLEGAVRLRTPDAARLQAALAGQGARTTLLDGNGLRVERASSVRVGEIAFAAGVVLHELVSESPTLEDVFLELTTGARS